MSDTQLNWLTGNIASSTTTWQIMGNQDIMAKLWYPAPVVLANAQGPAAFGTAVTNYLTLKAGNPANTANVPKIPINMDSWDGYPINRETLLQTVRGSGKKLVVLSVIIKVAFAGTEIVLAIGYAVPLPKVALFEIATVALTAEPVVFDTTILVTRLTVLAAGVSPVSAVVPLYVQLVVALVPEGVTYATLP